MQVAGSFRTLPTLLLMKVTFLAIKLRRWCWRKRLRWTLGNSSF